ncbi:hypothetical protein [Saprospira grandis]|uniref:hypothetical protein n=1 Tax=Saprospira grandis TaxID=1008 RepID=UPI00059B8EB8|nr:hypothetical protein [Saprospira grandis]
MRISLSLPIFSILLNVVTLIIMKSKKLIKQMQQELRQMKKMYKANKSLLQGRAEGRQLLATIKDWEQKIKQLGKL